MRLSSASVLAAERRRSVSRPRPFAVAATCLCLTMLAACNPLTSMSGPSYQAVTVAVVPGIESATLYLAKEQGLFAKAGLKVKIDDYRTVSQVMAALSSGAANVAAGDYGDLFAAQAASPLYSILADGYDAAPGIAEIMARPGSSITNPAGLAGQRIAVPDTGLVNGVPAEAPVSLAVAAAISVLQSESVNPSGMNWTPMSQKQELSELFSGKVPAILVTQPYVYLAQQQGAVEILDACSGATAGIPLFGYFSTRAWAAANSTAVTAFRSALAQADTQASMPGPVQAVLPRYTGLTTQEATVLTIGTFPLSTIPASLQRTADLMSVSGMIRHDLNVAAMIAP